METFPTLAGGIEIRFVGQKLRPYPATPVQYLQNAEVNECGLPEPRYRPWDGVTAPGAESLCTYLSVGTSQRHSRMC